MAQKIQAFFKLRNTPMILEQKSKKICPEADPKI
jgi:hypothetical protein